MPENRYTPHRYSPHTQTTENREPNKLFVHEIEMLLLNHKQNPEKWTFEYIAARYDISIGNAGNFFSLPA